MLVGLRRDVDAAVHLGANAIVETFKGLIDLLDAKAKLVVPDRGSNSRLQR